VITELILALSELVVLSRERLVHQPSSSRIHAHRLSGHFIDLRAQDRPTSCIHPPFPGLSIPFYDEQRINCMKTLEYGTSILYPLTRTSRYKISPSNEAGIDALLPVLSEFVVISRDDLVHPPFALFIRARRLSGHTTFLRVIKDRDRSRPRK
jgi:hypothetical protein